MNFKLYGGVGVAIVLLVMLFSFWTVVDVVDFSDSFDQAVEEKVKAEQQALQAKAQLEKSKLESEAIRIQAEAIKSSGGKEYVELKAIEKWNGVLPTYIGNGSTPFINLR